MLQAILHENIDNETGTLTYDLILHDFGNLSSQVLGVAFDLNEYRNLKRIEENINFLLLIGGHQK